MPSEWRDVVILTIRETSSKTKEGSGFGVWIIQKLRDGNHYNVTLRAGNYFQNKTTGERNYPKDGLTDWDLDALKKMAPNSTETYWAVAMRLLDRKNPPPVPQPMEIPIDTKPEAELPPWMK